jgi:formyltetrahydrofolate-dependent phosphoribosylglycinamide formyltransferase
MPQPPRLAVLLSGSGSTLQNLVDRIADGRLRASVAVVLSSRSDAFGLERARRAGIAAQAVPRKAYADTALFNDALHAALEPHAVDLIVLAGFLSLFQPRRYAGRVLNIHPALIPAFCGPGFYGRKVHEAALAAGVKVSGCTVHFADDQYDHGPIILQGCVPVLEGDTPESLAARVQELESELYPQAIQLWADDRLRIENGRVHIRPPR